MARRRLMSILAATLSAGLVALPASALPYADEFLTTTEETVASVKSELAGAVKATTDTLEGVLEPSWLDRDDGGWGDDGEPAEADDGSGLDLEPVTEPIEELITLLTPENDGEDRASTPAPGEDAPADHGSEAAPGDSAEAAASDATPPPASEPQAESSDDSRTSGSSTGSGGFAALRAFAQDRLDEPDAGYAPGPAPEIAAPETAAPEVAAPLTQLEVAPPDRAVLPFHPAREPGPSQGSTALKVLAALLVAGTAGAWRHVQDRVQI